MIKILALVIILMTSNLFAKVENLSSDELRSKYPNITEQSVRPENKKIICPFHRLIERAGLYDSELKVNSDDRLNILVSFQKMKSAVVEFGCKLGACEAIMTIANLGQLSHVGDSKNHLAKIGFINITRLHHARGLAHECGLTFAKGGTEVDDQVRFHTLDQLKELSNKNTPKGILKIEDLFQVKKEICKSQEVKMDKAGEVEVGLIFEYLGGDERGFVEYSDVERFLNAEMPLYKTSSPIGGEALKKRI